MARRFNIYIIDIPNVLEKCSKLGNKAKSGSGISSMSYGGKGLTLCYLGVYTLFALKASGLLKLQVNINFCPVEM